MRKYGNLWNSNREPMRVFRLNKFKDAKTGKSRKTVYRDPFISIIDPDVVSFPGDGGLWMSSGWDTLHDSRLPRRHHHIAGCLPEVVPQN